MVKPVLTKVISAHSIHFGLDADESMVLIGNYVYGRDHNATGYLSLDLPVGTVIHQVRPMVNDASPSANLFFGLFANSTVDGASSSALDLKGTALTSTTSTYDYYDMLFNDVTINQNESFFIYLRPELESGNVGTDWDIDIRIVKVEIEYTLP